MEFLLFTKNDQELLNQFSEWLDLPYIKKWYHDKQTWLDEIIDENNEYGFIKHYIVKINNENVGFCQYYDYELGKETWHNHIDIHNTISIDYLIGNENYLHKGIAKEIIGELTKKIFRECDALKIIVQPEKENIISRKSLLGAGYNYDEAKDIFYFLKKDL